MVRIIEQSAELRKITPGALEEIEDVGRDCYLSGDKIGPGTAEQFVKMIVSKGHGALLEFADARFRCVTNRAIANELVRHRVASYAQESTRYVNYTKDKFGSEIKVIEPWELCGRPFVHTDGGVSQHDSLRDVWRKLMEQAEWGYFAMLRSGAAPEVARDVLPLCTATVINIKANFREWIHILNLRFLGKAGKPHPQMVDLMRITAGKLATECPVIFDPVVHQVAKKAGRVEE